MSWVSISDTVPSTRLLRNQWRPSPFGQKLCAPLPGLQPSDDRTPGGIERDDRVLARERDQQPVVVGQHHDAGRCLADLDIPSDELRLQVEAATRALCCRVTNTGLRLIVEREVARHAVDEDAAGHLEVAVVAVDVDVIEPVGRGDEPLAVRREAQLIGSTMSRTTRLRSPVLGIERDQLVGDRRGDQQLLAVRRRNQVMRLAAERQARDLAAQAAAQHAVRGLFRVEDDDLVGARD
jgi:hypothetical protein